MEETQALGGITQRQELLGKRSKLAKPAVQPKLATCDQASGAPQRDNAEAPANGTKEVDCLVGAAPFASKLHPVLCTLGV